MLLGTEVMTECAALSCILVLEHFESNGTVGVTDFSPVAAKSLNGRLDHELYHDRPLSRLDREISRGKKKNG